MDRMIDPATGDYNGERTTGLENAAQMRLKTPLGSWLFDKNLGSKLHLLPRKDTEQARALAEQYAFQALSPLITDGRATAISVTASRKLPGWISLSVRITQATGDVATFEHPVKVSDMPLTIPSQDDIAEDYLSEVSNQLPDADVYSDSDYRVRANAIASTGWGLYQYAAWALRQAFPDTADTEYLEMHARLRNLTRKQATAASGSISLTGKAATTVASGLQFRVKGNATLYQTTEGGETADDGSLTVAAKATTTGTAGNLTAGATGALVSAPSGIDSAVTVVSMTGATDTETDEALLARLLDVMRQPAAGGNAHDYKVWAESVPGVSGAYVFPLRRGLGTADVVITATGGLPSAETLKAVQDYIDSVRPVGPGAAGCKVLAPTIKTVDVTAAIGISDSTTFDAAVAAITTSLNTWFNALIPGQEAIRSQVGALISDVDGVLDYELDKPTANVAPTVDETTVEWIRPGKFTFTQLEA